jgi:hypothetical protein
LTTSTNDQILRQIVEQQAIVRRGYEKTAAQHIQLIAGPGVSVDD